MPKIRRIQGIGVLGLCLLSVLLLRLACPPPLAPPASLAALPAPSARPRRPFDAALRAAWQYRMRARVAEVHAFDALETWDPEAASSMDQEAWRQQVMARDRGGDLRRAGAQARQAVILARTPRDTYRATELLARIECDAGHHERELRLAQSMMALAPWNKRSFFAVRHAAFCNGLKSAGVAFGCQTTTDRRPRASGSRHGNG